MTYSYYPGCSLQESAMEYDVSTRAVLDAMDVRIEEIPGWTCCGASAVEAVSELLATALPARNLALAARKPAGRGCAGALQRLLSEFAPGGHKDKNTHDTGHGQRHPQGGRPFTGFRSARTPSAGCLCQRPVRIH